MAWNVIDQLNQNAADSPKASFRTKNISIKKMYSNDANFYSMPDIEKLAQDIYVFGLIENLEVVYAPCERGDYRITAGERRWRALSLLVEQGHTEFELATCQIQAPQSENEERLRLIVANAYRNKTITDILEEERQLKEILQDMKKSGQTLKGYRLDSGRLRDVIADMLGMPASKVGQIESINKHLIPEFTTELKEGRLTFTAAYEISGMSQEAQEKILDRYRENGLTFKEVKEIKKQQEEEAAAASDSKKTGTEKAKDLTEKTKELYEGNVVKYLIVPKDVEIPAGLDKDMIVIQLPVEKAYVASEDALKLLDEQLDAAESIKAVGMEQKDCRIENIAKAMEDKKISFDGAFDDLDYKALVKDEIDFAILPSEFLPGNAKDEEDADAADETADTKAEDQKDDKDDKTTDEKADEDKTTEELLKEENERLSDTAERLATLTIPMLVDRSADEKTDLAKAEWLKVYGVIFGCEDQANELFQQMVKAEENK